MLKNTSIRLRILSGVVLINLLGAMAVMVYLHESYSSNIYMAAGHAASQGLAAWEQIKGTDVSVDPLENPEEVQRILSGMKEVTGADYGYLVDKDLIDQETYSAARETLGLPSNWEERDTLALLVATEGAPEDAMQFSVPPADVPENGRAIGIENGACSKMCHDHLTGEGDYWYERWSEDRKSRAFGVFPTTDVAGQPVGAVYVIEDISRAADEAKDSMNQTLAVIGITLLVATLVIGLMIDVLVFKRLRAMTASIEEISMRVAGGDFDAQFVPDGTNDEIGSFVNRPGFTGDLIP